MHIDVIERLDDLLALKRNWEMVHAADPEAHYFLSWTWISSWFRSRALPWLVLAAKEEPQDEAYVAFFPIQLGTGLDRGRGFYNTIFMGGSYYAAYTGLLCDPRFQGRAVPALADRIRGFNWTSLHLDDIYLSPERLLTFLDRFPPSEFSSGKVARPAHITRAGESIDHDVYVYVRLPGDFETFLDRNLGPRTRRNVRLCLRKLDEAGEFRITRAEADTIGRDLETFYSMWEAQWGAANPKYIRYILDNSRAMLPDCFRDGSLLLTILWKGDKPAAASVILIDRHRKSLVCFLGSRDAAFKNPSPGLMLHACNIRWAIENGFNLYDLGTGNYAYKYIFGSEEHRIERFRITTRTRRNLGERLDRRSLPVVLARASQLYEAGDAADAEIACRQVLAADPVHQGALALYRDIVSARAREAASMEAAFARHRAGDLIEAEKLYRALLAGDSRNFDAAHHLGILFLQRGEAKAAEAEMRRALEIRPDAASAHCNYGNVLAAIGDFDGAVVSYDRAIALEPRHAIAFNNRGNALRRLGLLDEALSSYEGAVALEPAYRQALDNRAALVGEMREEAMSRAG